MFLDIEYEARQLPNWDIVVLMKDPFVVMTISPIWMISYIKAFGKNYIQPYQGRLPECDFSRVFHPD